jgi:NitT/TauT family transport system substrate-binding protein
MGEDQVQQTLLAGSVEGGSILEPVQPIVTRRDPGAKLLVPGGALMPDQPGAVLAVRGSVLADHRDAVLALVRLHIRATAFALAEPDRAAADIARHVGNGLLDPALIRAALTSPATRLLADPHRIAASTALLGAFQASLGAPAADTGVFDFSLYDAATAPDGAAP